MADTWASFYAAYTIAPLVFAAYAFSIWRRAKKVRDRTQQLESGAPRR